MQALVIFWRIPDKVEDGVKMPADITKYPIIKSFITDSAYSSDSQNNLYDYNSELTTRAKEHKQTGEYRYIKDSTPGLIGKLEDLRKKSNKVIAKLADERMRSRQ